jgi:DNA-binding CsgD family transcriptional regulator
LVTLSKNIIKVIEGKTSRKADMNRTLRYDVTDIQVSHNSDGTLHIVFTVPDCPAKRSSDEREVDLISPVAHTYKQRTHGYVRKGPRLEATNTSSLKTLNIGGDDVLIETLSQREQEVLTVLSKGTSNQEIAQALMIAPNTVKRHVRAILAKLGATNRTQAVTYALQFGLLT